MTDITDKIEHIFYNEDTLDCYSIVLRPFPNDHGRCDVLALSKNPDSPLGFSQCIEGSVKWAQDTAAGLGRDTVMTFTSLPNNIQRHIQRRLAKTDVCYEKIGD